MRSLIRNIYNLIPSSKIMMVHHVCDEEPLIPSCIIKLNHFESFLKGKNFYPLKEILRKPSLKGYSLTFDDGLEDLYTIVYPLLNHYQIPFTAFVSGSLIGTPGYISINQLLEISHNPLVTIGSHGLTHKHLTSLSVEESHYEIVQSKFVLEKILNHKIDLIAYPYGDISEREINIAKRAGYKFGFDVLPRNFNALSLIINKMRIPRFNLTDVTFNI